MMSTLLNEFYSFKSLPKMGLRICLSRISLWRERARQRRALRQLDDYMLRDLGLTRLDVDREAARPFWE
jgi:uncharacterized protein YjiS (DUF1127 family)